jgi:hypothetical protein
MGQAEIDHLADAVLASLREMKEENGKALAS